MLQDTKAATSWDNHQNWWEICCSDFEYLCSFLFLQCARVCNGLGRMFDFVLWKVQLFLFEQYCNCSTALLRDYFTSSLHSSWLLPLCCSAKIIQKRKNKVFFPAGLSLCAIYCTVCGTSENTLPSYILRLFFFVLEAVQLVPHPYCKYTVLRLYHTQAISWTRTCCFFVGVFKKRC